MEQRLDFDKAVKRTRWQIIKQFIVCVFIAYIIPISTISIDVSSNSGTVGNELLAVFFNVSSWIFISLSLVVIVSFNLNRLLVKVRTEMEIVYHESMWLSDSKCDSELTLYEFVETNRRIKFMQQKIKNMIRDERTQKKEIAFQVSALTHDLKTPLTIIKGNSELLQLSGVSDSDKQSIRDIEIASEKLEDYFNQLISYSKAFYLREPAIKNYKVSELESIIQNEYLYLVGEDVRLEFVSELSDCDCLIVNIDLDMFLRSVANVVRNAVEYADDSQKIIIIILTKDHRYLKVSVWNNGPKFSASVLRNYAKLFYREDKSRGNTDEHFGIGLAFVKKALDVHNGKMQLMNMNDGAQVDLMLPISSKSL